MNNLINLENKVAIITGASKGFGKSFSKALAEAGANIVIFSRNKDNLYEISKIITNLGREILVVECDISKQNDIKKMVEKTIKKFKRIDILINNAGSMRNNIPPEKTTLEDQNSIINTNITGTFMVAKEVAPKMIKQKKGKIINTSSIAGFIIPRYFHGGSYDITKFAIVGMTKALAVEWAKYNINVISIAPGFYGTKPNLDYFEKDPIMYKKILELIPLRKLGNIDELSGLVVCLASDITNYMTGTTIIIDGGYTLL